jgi:hypothetical protein
LLPTAHLRFGAFFSLKKGFVVMIRATLVAHHLLCKLIFLAILRRIFFIKKGLWGNNLLFYT